MSKGFTFIELAVAAGIMLSLVGLGAASYVNFQERSILEKEGKNLMTILRTAQTNATQGVKDNDLCDPDYNISTGINGPRQPETFRGWCISPVHSDSADASAGNPYDSYQIYGVCDTNEEDSVEPRTFPGSISQLDLPDGILLEVRSFSSSISGGYERNVDNSRARFNVFGDDVQLADDTYTKVVFCLEGSFPSLGTQDVYQITVNRSGEINDDGFVTACATN